jgi:hypothetical protein
MGGWYYRNNTLVPLTEDNRLPVGTRFYFWVKSEYYTREGWLPWAYQKVQLLKDGGVLEEGNTDVTGVVFFPTTRGATYTVEEGTHEYVAVTVAGPNNTESRSKPIKITGEAAVPPPPPVPWWQEYWWAIALAAIGGIAIVGVVWYTEEQRRMMMTLLAR